MLCIALPTKKMPPLTHMPRNGLWRSGVQIDGAESGMEVKRRSMPSLVSTAIGRALFTADIRRQVYGGVVSHSPSGILDFLVGNTRVRSFRPTSAHHGWPHRTVAVALAALRLAAPAAAGQRRRTAVPHRKPRRRLGRGPDAGLRPGRGQPRLSQRRWRPGGDAAVLALSPSHPDRPAEAGPAAPGRPARAHPGGGAGTRLPPVAAWRRAAAHRSHRRPCGNPRRAVPVHAGRRRNVAAALVRATRGLRALRVGAFGGRDRRQGMDRHT